LHWWVEAFELDAGILGGKLPVHTLVTLMSSLLPCPGFVAQCLNIWNPPIKALSDEGRVSGMVSSTNSQSGHAAEPL